MDPEELYDADDKKDYVYAITNLVKALNEDYLPSNPIFGMLKDVVYEMRNNYGD